MTNIVFFSAMMATMFLSAISVVGQEQATAPVHEDGDFWHFRVIEKDFLGQSSRPLTGNYEVTYKKEGGLTITRNGAETSRMNELLNPMLALEDAERQYLQFPLAADKEWSTEYVRPLREATVRESAEAKVTGVEEVATGAGSFKAFKIERYETASYRSGGRRISREVKVTYYYSPQTRSVVKYIYGSSRNRVGLFE